MESLTNLAVAGGFMAGLGVLLALLLAIANKMSGAESRRFLDDFKDVGGRGIEVTCGSHSPDHVMHFARLARHYEFHASIEIPMTAATSDCTCDGGGVGVQRKTWARVDRLVGLRAAGLSRPARGPRRRASTLLAGPTALHECPQTRRHQGSRRTVSCSSRTPPSGSFQSGSHCSGCRANSETEQG